MPPFITSLTDGYIISQFFSDKLHIPQPGALVDTNQLGSPNTAEWGFLSISTDEDTDSNKDEMT